jgi:hypothetical protein
MTKRFEVGQQVRVVDNGNTFDTYEAWAKKRGFEIGWGCSPENGEIGTVFTIGLHEGATEMLHGVKIGDKNYIIGENGLERDYTPIGPIDLKPGMRVIMCGEPYIVMPLAHDGLYGLPKGTLVGVHTNGWNRISFTHGGLSGEFKVSQVYAAPPAPWEALNTSKLGELLWCRKAEEEKQRKQERIVEIDAQIAKLAEEKETLTQ